MLSLERNGEQDTNTVLAIDELAYSYSNNGNSNQLVKVGDSTGSPAGYNDGNGNSLQDDFEYDDYGNLILDRDKNITSVMYNHLNLPTKITFGAQGHIEYLYDAAGIKLKKTVQDMSTPPEITDYMDGFHYNTSGTLDFFPHAEGYVKALYGFGASQYKYVFNYTDHLGNIRLSYTQDPQNGNQLAILEENHYYPYGLKHNGYNGNHKILEITPGGSVALTPVNPFLGDTYKYKFGGKEYDDTFNINTYDFGARNYDPALGRWMNIDPLAEVMRRYSPYNYAFNNPIFFIDPDGMAPGGFANINLATSTGAMEISDFGKGNESGKLKSGGDSGGGASNNSAAYKSYFKAGAEKVANTYYSLGGEGECCGGKGGISPQDFGPPAVADFNGEYSGVPNGGSILNPATVKQNIPLIGGRSTYAGGNNPTTFSGKSSYQYVPDMVTDYPAIGHDRRYDNLGAAGASSVFLDTRTIGADYQFVKEQYSITISSFNPATKVNSFLLGTGMALGALPKTIYQYSKPYGIGAMEVSLWNNIGNTGVSNKPGQ